MPGQFLGEQIVGIFVQDEEVIAIGAKGLAITSWFYFFLGNEYSGQALGGGITGQTVSGIINAIKGPADQLVLKHNAPAQAQQAKVIRTPNQPIQQTYPQNVIQNPVLNQAKLGTKRIKQRNTNRFK